MLLIVFMPIFANVQPGHWFVAQLKTRNFAILLYVCAYIECYKRWAVPSWYCDDFLPVYIFCSVLLYYNYLYINYLYIKAVEIFF